MRTLTRSIGAVALPGAIVADACSTTPSLTLVGWHRIGPGGWLSTSFDDFRWHLDALAEWGASVLPLPEAVERLRAGTLPARAVALTFDDGYASVLEQAWPELRARSLPATLFAVSDFLDGGRRFPWDTGADAEEVRLADRRALVEAAGSGLDIGSHTATHRWLPHLPPEDVAAELRTSRLELEDLLQRPVRTMAYPMGGWNASVRALAAQAGYDVGVTVDRGRNRPTHDPLALRRAFAFDDVRDFRRQLLGAYTWSRPLERWRTRHGPLAPPSAQDLHTSSPTPGGPRS